MNLFKRASINLTNLIEAQNLKISEFIFIEATLNVVFKCKFNYIVNNLFSGFFI